MCRNTVQRLSHNIHQLLMQSTFPAKMLIKLFKKFFAFGKSLFNIV